MSIVKEQRAVEFDQTSLAAAEPQGPSCMPFIVEETAPLTGSPAILMIHGGQLTQKSPF
jgi:hypothetical protein